MERFIIGVAFATAALFAVGAGTGGVNLSINLGSHGGLHASSGTAGQPLTQTSSAFAATALRFEDGVARIKIIPEDRADIAVSLTASGSEGLTAPVARLERNTLVLDGNLGARLQRCTSQGAEVQGVGEVTAATAPQIEVRMPRAVVVDIRAAGMAEIGPAQTLSWDVSGCAPSSAEDVAGLAQVDKSGAGPLKLAGTAVLELDLAGAGVVTVGTVRERFDADIAGSGEVTAASVTGALNADLAGSGSLAVQSGTISDADVSIAGSGTVKIAAPVTNLDVSAMGSGSVDVAGAVGDLSVDLAGSGEVRVQKVTGSQRQSVAGSGRVRIGE